MKEFLNLIKTNNYTAIKSYLRKNKNVNISGKDNFPIQFAAKNGHDKAVKILLSFDEVDPTAKNNFALKHAIKNGHEKVLKLLIKDERMNQSFFDILQYAIKGRHDAIAKFLLSSIYDDYDVMEIDDKDFQAAFMAAALNGSDKIAKLIFHHKDYEDVFNIDIDKLIKKEQYEILKFLVKELENSPQFWEIHKPISKAAIHKKYKILELFLGKQY